MASGIVPAHPNDGYYAKRSGFSLVELSIVLVILGLLTGGILAGKSLIDAAALRAQIVQIEGYMTALNTFRAKYGFFPGDFPDPYASRLGFQTRGTLQGQGDGNGLLEGYCNGSTYGWFQGCGENAVLWEDLSVSGLINDSIVGYEVKGVNYPYMLGFNIGPELTTTPSIYDWLPEAKLRSGDFVYSYSVDGGNYLALSSVTKIGWSLESTVDPGVSVQEAYSIDMKMDDGLPQAGRVTACYVNKEVGSAPIWSAGGGQEGNGGNHCEPTTDATPSLDTNCFDNGNVVGTQQYALQNSEARNCALSFRF